MSCRSGWIRMRIVPVFVGMVINLSCNMLFARFEFTFDTLYALGHLITPLALVPPFT